MSNNYTSLTGHKRKPKPPHGPQMVPKIDQRLVISTIMIFQDEAEEGKLCTPMSKIRWFPEQNEWRQVGRHEAGMFVFFNNEPQPTHTACIVRSIIPSRTACYADLV